MSETIPKTQLAIVVTEELKQGIKEIPVFEPKDDEVLIKAVAWGRGPGKAFPLVPDNINSICGYDFSGVVVKIGENVTSLKIGDHVASMCVGGFTPIPATGAWSEYVISREHVTYKFNFELKSSDAERIETGPIDTFEGASNIANTILTVGASFWGPFNLRKGQDHSNDVFLIWGGGAAIGMFAVQVAVWLGFKKVVATCSPSKFELLKKIGATSVYDYHDKNVVDKIRSDYGDEINYAIDCFAHPDSFSLAYDVTSRTKPVKLANLLHCQESDLINVVKKTNPVEFIRSSSFLTYGNALKLFGRDVPAQPHLVEIAKVYQREIRPLLDSNKLSYIGAIKVKGGLYGFVNHSGEGAPSNFKFFARAVETKKSESTA